MMPPPRIELKCSSCALQRITLSTIEEIHDYSAFGDIHIYKYDMIEDENLVEANPMRSSILW